MFLAAIHPAPTSYIIGAAFPTPNEANIIENNEMNIFSYPNPIYFTNMAPLKNNAA